MFPLTGPSAGNVRPGIHNTNIIRQKQTDGQTYNRQTDGRTDGQGIITVQVKRLNNHNMKGMSL